MAAKTVQKPTIELYMYSLHQEFPEGVSHDSFVKQNVEARDILSAAGDKLRVNRLSEDLVKKASDWPAQWLHAKWVTDHTKAITGIFEQATVSPLEMALTREEDFGGVIYDPFSDKVYKVNESGLALFREMQTLQKKGAGVEAFKSEAFKGEDVKEFTAFLKGAGLWTGK